MKRLFALYVGIGFVMGGLVGHPRVVVSALVGACIMAFFALVGIWISKSPDFK